MADPSWSKRISLLVLTLFLSCAFGCMSIVRVDEMRSKEAVLKEDLYSIRNAIDEFSQDKGQPPASLTDLVTAGYLHELPLDPFTKSRLTWKAVYEDTPGGPDDTPLQRPKGLSRNHGITDVRQF